MAAPAVPGHEQVEQEDAQDQDPGQPHAEHDSPEQDRYRIDQFPDNAAGYQRQDQGQGEYPVTCAPGSVGSATNAQFAAQPGSGIRDHVHRAYPGTIDTSANQGIESQHDEHANNGSGLRHHTGKHGLQQDVGIGQGQGFQRKAGSQVALHDPQIQPGTRHEGGEYAQLADAPEDEPPVSGQPSLFGDGFLSQVLRHVGHQSSSGLRLRVSRGLLENGDAGALSWALPSRISPSPWRS